MGATVRNTCQALVWLVLAMVKDVDCLPMAKSGLETIWGSAAMCASQGFNSDLGVALLFV
jgi:hypothetical protein